MSLSNRRGQAEHWQQRLEQYLKHLTALNRSPGTISDHKTVVGRWITYAISHNEDPGVFDEAAVEGYLDTLTLAANSHSSYVSHIRGWCNYLQNRGAGTADRRMGEGRRDGQPEAAWVVRAGREGEEEQHNLDHSVVTIGWHDFEELDSMTNRQEFGERLAARYPDGDTRSARDQLWRFAKEISVEDLVVMPQKRPELGGRRLLAIGSVVGPYEWDPAQPDDVRHRRKVQWLQTDLPREVVQDDLDRSLNGLTTIYSLKPNDAQYRIKYLAEHGEDPGDRNPDNGQRETWHGRLEEYLDDLGQDESPRTKQNRRSSRQSILSRWIDFALTASQSPIVAGPLVEEFLSDLRDGDLKESTRRNYENVIETWCAYWDDPEDSRAPDNTDTRSLQERLQSAAEKLLCEVSDLQEIVDLLEDKGQVILYGPPGTGKTYLAQELAEALVPDERARSLVQFHPAYSYEDFFEGYRPVVDEKKQMTYELTPGPLAELADSAAEYPEQQHVMVIDEINRANLPRVLGELLFLLEYRDKSIQVMNRTESNFNLPKNLWFIGTMNTADRSIALIDAAMRRRFHFVPFFPEREPTKSLLRKWISMYAPGQAWVVNLVSAVNDELAKALGGEHLQLGPSHFMRTDLDDGGFERVWRYNIEPFVEDQLFGNPDKINRFRLEAVLQRHGPEHFEGADLLDVPAAPADELPSSSGQSSSGGRAAVSPEMRQNSLVRGLEERLGDRLRFHPAHAPAGFLLADTVGPEGFSLRTLHSNQNVSLLNVTGGRPNVVYFPPRASLDRLVNKRSEIEAYANALLALGLDISQFGPQEKPSLSLSDVLGALDQISECVAALA